MKPMPDHWDGMSELEKSNIAHCKKLAKERGCHWREVLQDFVVERMKWVRDQAIAESNGEMAVSE